MARGANSLTGMKLDFTNQKSVVIKIFSIQSVYIESRIERHD